MTVSTFVYPCDRGVPGNVLGRGLHHFEASPSGVVVCRYCGKGYRPPETSAAASGSEVLNR